MFALKRKAEGKVYQFKQRVMSKAVSGMVPPLPANSWRHLHGSIVQTQPGSPGLQELALKLKANGKVYKPKKRVKAEAVSGGGGAPAGATALAKPQRGVQNARPGSRPQDIGFEGKEETGTRPDKPPQVGSGDPAPWLMRLRRHWHGAAWASKQGTDCKHVKLQWRHQQPVEQHGTASTWITFLPWLSQSRQAVV